MGFYQRILLACLACLVYKQGAQAVVTVDVTVSEPPGSTHYPGHNVTILCRMTGGYPGIFVYWYKMVVQETGNHLQELIATNDELAPLYRSMPGQRFEAKVVNSIEGVSLFILNIYGITREDSGHYGCSVPKADNAYSQGELEVAVPPSDIYFANYSSGDTVELVEGQPVSLHCHVREVLPTPAVSMVISSRRRSSSGHMMSQKVDEIPVHAQSSLVEKCTQLADGKTCPLHFTYDYVVSTHPSFIPSMGHDGSILECIAELEGTHYEPTVTSVNIMVKYAPRITCETWQEAPLGRDYSIKCRVKAQPGPSSLKWEFEVDGVPMLLDAYTAREDEFEAYVEVISADTRDCVLLVRGVRAAHFTTYTLRADNALGKAADAVRLEQATNEYPDYSVVTEREYKEYSIVADQTLALSAAASRIVSPLLLFRLFTAIIVLL